MNLGLKDKRALVTGASRGLGKSIAQCLAREGARVAVAARNAGQVERLAEELGGRGAGHVAVSLDLAAEGSPRTLVEQLGAEDFHAVDIVVHNLGGTLDVNDPFCSVHDWRRVWRTNIEVAIELNLLLVPGMRQRRWGRVVHISSISAMENHGPVPYCSVKAALTAYARSFGRVVAPDGVVVTAVLPGAVFTEGGYWDEAARERPDHVEKYLADRMAIHRFGEPDEIGNVVDFLCSEQASFCIGSIVPIDWGQGRSFFGQ